MLQVLPEADIFCALDVLPERFRGRFKDSKIRTSFIQRLPIARHLHRYSFALMPLAVERHDLSTRRGSALLPYARFALSFFAAEEDFGIAPVEAQACGTPVIAFGRGRATERVIDGGTGLFFYEQTSEAVVKAVGEFELCRSKFDRNRIRRNAERFGTGRFYSELREFVYQRWAGRCQSMRLRG